MHRRAKASAHAKRRLSPRERSTIAVALQMLCHYTLTPQLESKIAEHCGDDGLLSDVDMDALATEISTARKVKVCRSKISNA